MQATLKNYRQAPRKVRLVTDLIKGKKIEDAEIALSFLPKRASEPVLKLLKSAINNASQSGADLATLIVKEARVDKGVVLKRHMPRARGSASAIRKHSSHITLVLESKEPKAKKVKKVAAKKESK